MSPSSRKFLEHTFFFVVLFASGYLVWKLFSPFMGAIALAAIIVTICYPLYERIIHVIPNHSTTLAALLSLVMIVVVIFLPLIFLASFILREALSIYELVNVSSSVSFLGFLSQAELFLQKIIPTFTFGTTDVVQQAASFVASNLVSIFAGTASTIFLFFITLVAAYYFFRDGKVFTTYLVYLSPLKDIDDELILRRLAVAVRSVALGSVFIAIVQGVLTAVGLSIFGFDRAILWGCIAAFGALIPGVGTTIVFVPSIIYLFATGEHLSAVALALWGALAVGLIDNLLGPYVMSRGNKVHPFLLLMSVLGGIVLFGPVGFIIGPVILSLFLVFLELYNVHSNEL
ncbi:MAG: AI-2E family transporter [Candidatus Pacebacteria bacterium]|nr:AI-2E family transporter [Candidatus Paceibacterota bacterium]MCF7857225.1 AI-2E family transporter [Candidatus Paceibacterota bacterium]